VDQHIRAFIGIDTSKWRNAVAVAEEGRDGDVRYLGEIDTTEAATPPTVTILMSAMQSMPAGVDDRASVAGFRHCRRGSSLEHDPRHVAVVAPGRRRRIAHILLPAAMHTRCPQRVKKRPPTQCSYVCFRQLRTAALVLEISLHSRPHRWNGRS
jgi:hypothetical protein